MGSIYKVGDIWYANYVNAGGKRVRGSLHEKSEDDAEAALKIILNQVEYESLTEKSRLEQTTTTTLREFSIPYLNWRESEYPASQPRTKEAMDNHILPEFGDDILGETSPYKVENWKVKRRKAGAAPATIKKELDVLKAALNKAVEWEVIIRHRIARVSPPKILKSGPPPFYELDQLQTIYGSAAKYKALWKFVANTGMRRGEIRKARRQDIWGGAIRIESTEESRTKSGEWRLVPLSPGALEALEDLPDDYLAPRLHINSLGRAFARDAKKAELNGSIHWLRHTFISHLVMGGVDLKTVQELAGHKNYETTLKYAHLSKLHLEKAVVGLSI